MIYFDSFAPSLRPLPASNHDRHSHRAAPGARAPGGRGHLGEGRLGFAVGKKDFAWTFLRRVAPRRPRQPDIHVLALRCGLRRKAMLIEAAPERFFDDEHYRGYPAALVRLDNIEEDELATLLLKAWRLTAPKRLARSRH